MELVLKRAELPEAANRMLQAAQNAYQPWTPDADDLRVVAESWDRLESASRDYARIEHRVLAADPFPPEFEDDVVTKGSDFAMMTKERPARPRVTGRRPSSRYSRGRPRRSAGRRAASRATAILSEGARNPASRVRGGGRWGREGIGLGEVARAAHSRSRTGPVST